MDMNWFMIIRIKHESESEKYKYCWHRFFFLQRYAFLLKAARNFGKMLEGEEDKKKKVYPRLPDVLGKKDTPYYIIVLLFPFLSNR